MTFFDISFWQQLVVTVLALVLGIPAGLFLHRRIAQRAASEDRRQLTHALHASLRTNRELLTRLEDQTLATPIPLDIPAPFDLTILDATAAGKYDVLQSIPTCKAIDAARYELIQLDGKVRVIRDLVGHISHNSHLQDVHRAAMRSCAKDIPQARSSIEAGLKALGVRSDGS